MKTQNTPWPFPHQKPEVSTTTSKGILTMAQLAASHGVEIFYCFNRSDPKSGGFTVAWRKSNAFKSGKMVDLAVSYCSRGDMFSKDIGRAKALQNFLAGRTITVPAYEYGRDFVHGYIAGMFSQD
jgi:hypothetical protein